MKNVYLSNDSGYCCPAHDVYKVEAIGDAYMCASGVPERNGYNHVLEICTVTMAFVEVNIFVIGCIGYIIQAAPSVHVNHMDVDYVLRVRGGVHSGAVAAGVIGVRAPRYCMFGDTVSEIMAMCKL